MANTFSATIQHVTHTVSRATVRTHTMLVDRGVAKDGFDLGPAGGEYLVLSLGGCFTSHLAAAIRARNAEVTDVRVAVTGTLSGQPERFTSFTLDVSAQCADASLGRKLVVIAARGCQVFNTLKAVAPIAVSFQGAVFDIDGRADSTADLG